MSKRILVLLFVSLIALPSFAAAGLTANYLQTAGNGVIWYNATSEHNGPGTTLLRVLQPTNPAPGMPHRFIYVLPVITDVDLQNEFGDGLEELLALNVHNAYNASIIAPSFQAAPWDADHTSVAERKYETFMVQDLAPWVRANLSVTGQEEHWLIGFSKSGFGAVTLLFRNPTVFHAAASWDFPADQPDPFDWNMLDNYGTNANFQNNYRLTSGWIAARGAPFQAAPRLWLSDDYATYYGTLTFRDEVLAFAGRLLANGIQFLMEASGAIRPHTWTSGWLPQAVAGLQSMRFGAPPDTSPHDDFNRPDGGLGSKWMIDPVWGTGTQISGNQVTTSVGDGGAYYWNAGALGPDQYSQIRITGDIGVWTGVSVRGRPSPSQAYWVAVKNDGAYLYSVINGVFHELVHDATPWSTGDVLRLEARTVATNTARLTVRRNNVVLFTHDDTAYFIPSGQPGIGMYASGAMALDDWGGGTLNPETDTTPPVRSNGSPSGTLAAATTQTTLSLTTNEGATCRYATSPGVAYGSMTNTFVTTGGTAHSTTVTGLTNGGSYSYFVRCQDAATNANTNDFTIAFSVAQPADTTPPVRSNGSPSGTLAAGTTQTTLSLTTNESAACRYSTTPGVAYGSMPGIFVAAGLNQSAQVNGLTNGSNYNFYVRCQDSSANVNPDDFTISFSVAVPTTTITAAPAGTTILTGTLSGGTAAALASDNNVYYAVSSTTGGTRTSSWYASFPGVARNLTGLRVSYKGKNSRNTTQAILIWNWISGAWVQLDSRTVGTTEVAISNLVPAGAPANYVSGSGASGEVRVSVQCQTTANFTNQGDLMSLAYDVPVGTPPPDTTAPVLSNGQPSGALAAGTTQATLSLTTNEIATCRYSTTAGVAYGSMTNGFATTGALSHSTPVSGLANGISYNFFVRCQDGSGNANTSDFTISFSVAQSGGVVPGLVAAYGMNQGSGASILDSSGNGQSGAISGAAWNSQGKFGSCLSFNGSNSLVTVNSTSFLNLSTGMTLEAWVFPTTNTGTRDVLIKEGPGVDIYNLYARNWRGLPEANVFVSGSNRTAEGSALAANVWTHLAATYDGSTVRLFINGVQVASTAFSGSITSSNNPLRIGGNSLWGEYFQGMIDEVRIYNRALTQTEIQNDMTRPITP